MKTYHGFPECNTHGGFKVIVVSAKDEGYLDPKPSQKLYNHSPNGFNWGYGGSGPAQLALALLLDVTGDPDLSCKLHQEFKWDIIAGWKKDQPWTYCEEQIKEWVRISRRDGVTK